MNTTTKTALGTIFALVAIYLLLLNVAVLAGAPMNSMATFGEVIVGRDLLWTPVLFWAFIPTVMLLAMSVMAVSVTVRFRQQKTGSIYLESPTASQSADIHTLTSTPERHNQQSERSSRKAS